MVSTISASIILCQVSQKAEPLRFDKFLNVPQQAQGKKIHKNNFLIRKLLFPLTQPLKRDSGRGVLKCIVGCQGEYS